MTSRRRGRQALFAISGLLLVAAASGGWTFAEDGPANDAPAVDRGLVLWLDAGAIAPERGVQGLPPLGDGQPVAVWNDRSPAGRRFIQRREDAQPRLELATVDDRPFAVVRFDGVDDSLEAAATGLRPEAFTLLMVARPVANPGLFRGLFSGNAPGLNDYTTGFNVDLGPDATSDFSVLNIEGRGFGGARNLLGQPRPLGTFQQFTVSAGADDVRLFVHGRQEGVRPRQPGLLDLEELAIGCRFYSNDERPGRDAGWFAGDVAEILLFDRALPDAERRQVEDHLAAKYAPWLALTSSAEVDAVLDGPPPPEVQVFVPGFEVRRLPVELTNLIDLQYDTSGRLWLLGYDGRIRIAEDSDGDGLEDRARVWWETPTLINPMAMVLAPDGVLVAVREKIVRLSDADGDGRGDTEKIVATDWAPPKNYSGGVDSVGLALAPNGDVYFGLGTSDYSNAYLVDASTGEAAYDLAGERGTIQRVTPDGRRETWCTGVRFPVGMAFDAAGRLFAAEQEGATWLPNGNPFDELLHIRQGLHFGFPPRHPRHLPNVVDEPSTLDFEPQHQSTCGLLFNLPAEGRPVFGPEAWRGDAFTFGYSRGKLWRVELQAAAEGGIVARPSLFASFRSLLLDGCLARDGSLIAAVHSGGPDWGSGPQGTGTLYKLQYTARETPQPVLAWSAGPQEVRIAFDRPLSPEHLAGLAGSVQIEYGPYVAAGDRFEAQRPGYEVVRLQQQAPRRSLAVHSIQVSPDRRTLLLFTDRHPAAQHYALSLPWGSRGEATVSPGEASASLRAPGPAPQSPEIDLQYTLAGVQAEWTSAAGDRTASLWLPHLDLDLARRFTRGSAEHEAFFDHLLQSPGRLTLSTQVDLSKLLQPVVQPGSQLDFEPPPEQATLELWGPAFARGRETTIDAAGAARVEVVESADGGRPRADAARGAVAGGVRVHYAPGKNGVVPLRLSMSTSPSAPPEVHAAFRVDGVDTLRPLPLRRFRAPWAPSDSAGDAAPLAWTPIVELAGGSWERGRKLFESDAVQCAKCHVVRGRGGKIGPDLSNLIHRDLASVRRDVLQPSFSINPDFVSHTIALHDGRVLTGVVRYDGDQAAIGDAKAQEVRVLRSEIESIAPQSTSVMPEGLLKNLSEADQRDLFAYLLSPPPIMPPDLPGAPPPRRRAELDAVLAGSVDAATDRPLRVLLVVGAKDHGPGEHDYPAFQKAWGTLLACAPGVSVDTAWEFPAQEQLEQADVAVFFQRGSCDDQRRRLLDEHLAQGRGLVFIHWAVEAGEQAESFAEVLGLASNAARTQYRHGPLDLVFDRSRHPITRNFRDVHFHDESYWSLIGDPARIEPLATGEEEGAPRPLFWVRETPAGGPSAASQVPDAASRPPRAGRVFVSILGHYSWTFDDPLYRVLLLRALCWTAHEPVDRLNALSSLGTTLTE